MKTILSSAAALALLAGCGGPTVHTWPTGGCGTVDASLCSAPHPELALRCTAATTSPRIALGVCGDLTANNTLNVDSDVAGMSLAVNGKSTTSSPLTVKGGFVSFGDIDARNTQDVSGTVQTAGMLSLSAPVHVGGDAYLGSGLVATNSFDVDGTLHAPDGTAMVNVQAGSVALGPVSVSKPLACGAAVNAQDLINASLASRDGAANEAIPTNALDGVKNPTDLTLGCGRYVFTQVQIDNTLTIHVTGVTELVVQGDFHVSSPTVIDVAPGAQLDLVIGGNLNIDNTLTIGDGSHPDHTWVVVGNEVHVASPFELDGALSAASASFHGDNTVQLNGAALVGDLSVSAPINVHPDSFFTNDGCFAQ